MIIYSKIWSLDKMHKSILWNNFKVMTVIWPELCGNFNISWYDVFLTDSDIWTFLKSWALLAMKDEILSRSGYEGPNPELFWLWRITSWAIRLWRTKSWALLAMKDQILSFSGYKRLTMVSAKLEKYLLTLLILKLTNK